MPPVFWLAQVRPRGLRLSAIVITRVIDVQLLAIESEGRLKEAMAIMSLKSSVYYAANATTYIAVCALGWLIVAVIFTFLVSVSFLLCQTGSIHRALNS